MPKILILGATGYIGLPLSLSLRRAGHTIYGLARTPSKSHLLSVHEILPVLGSAEDSTAWVQLIRSAHIDVVIDCAGANHGSRKILEDVVGAGRERLERGRDKGQYKGGRKLGFVYVSGTWVHGDSLTDVVNETHPVGEHARTKPPALVAWRPAMEQAVLSSSDTLDVAVVRPALVYGGEGGLFGTIFGPVLKVLWDGAGSARVPVTRTAWPLLIHRDDVVSGVHCIIDHLPLLQQTYPVFDLVSSNESYVSIVEAFAKAVGYKGELQFIGPQNAFDEAMNTSGRSDSDRAEVLCGWRPRLAGMVRGMEVYAHAFRAAQEQAKA